MTLATAQPQVLIVVTSCDALGSTGRKTGFYFDEMAAPYWAFREAGYTVDIASMAGGKAPADPGSVGEAGKRAAAVERFMSDPASMALLEATLPVEQVDGPAYAAVFLPGGHGTMWDFDNPTLGRVISAAWAAGAVVGAVCHGPAGLVTARRADGQPLVAGMTVNSFTDAEEAAAGLTDVVPFLLETRLRELGARFEAGPNFQTYAVRDGRLVTGQNPRSATRVAELMLAALADQQAAAA